MQVNDCTAVLQLRGAVRFSRGHAQQAPLYASLAPGSPAMPVIDSNFALAVHPARVLASFVFSRLV
jgi:hypothetical protein